MRRLMTIAISLGGLGPVTGFGCSADPSTTSTGGSSAGADAGAGGSADASGGRDASTSGRTGGVSSTGGSSTGASGIAGATTTTGGMSGTGGIGAAGTGAGGSGQAGLPGTGGDSGQPSSCEAIAGLTASDCSPVVVPSVPAPTNVLLVVDKSGSMQDESVYDQPKWDAVTQALTDTLSAENVANNAQISLGLLLFPGADVTDTCSVEECCSLPNAALTIPMGAAPETGDEIVDMLAATVPAGLTPTAAALDQALAYYRSGPGSVLEGSKYVLLATDGGPNCNSELSCGDDECTLVLDGQCATADCCAGDGRLKLWCVDWQQTQNTISELASVGVKTIVVGMPGSEAYAAWLDGFADAGQFVAPGAETEGAPHYYRVDSSNGVEGLTGTLRGVFQELARSCRQQLSPPQASLDPARLNVAVGCSIVSARLESSGTDSWKLDESTEPPSMEITGAYCERVRRDAAPIDVLLGCPRVEQ